MKRAKPTRRMFKATKLALRRQEEVHARAKAELRARNYADVAAARRQALDEAYKTVDEITDNLITVRASYEYTRDALGYAFYVPRMLLREMHYHPEYVGRVIELAIKQAVRELIEKRDQF